MIRNLVVGRLLVVSLTLLPATTLGAQAASPAERAAIDSFNVALTSATRSMNNEAVLSLWDDDGVSLLPNTKPIIGKRAVADFLRATTEAMPGARMEHFDMTCHDIEVVGDLATEWCTEHQIVRLPGGRPPFDGWGKMLFVLRRGDDGAWRIRTEMWNQAMPDSGR